MARSVTGTTQGANVAGGLGVDHEFFESVLVPQVMLYGFLGFQPTVDGFAIDPMLPADWPELTVSRIHLHDQVLDLTVRQNGEIAISGVGPAGEPLVIHVRDGAKVSAAGDLKFTTAALAE